MMLQKQMYLKNSKRKNKLNRKKTYGIVRSSELRMSVVCSWVFKSEAKCNAKTTTDKTKQKKLKKQERNQQHKQFRKM